MSSFSSFTPFQLIATLLNLSSCLGQTPGVKSLSFLYLKPSNDFSSPSSKELKAFQSLTLLPITPHCSYFSDFISFYFHLSLFSPLLPCSSQSGLPLVLKWTQSFFFTPLLSSTVLCTLSTLPQINSVASPSFLVDLCWNDISQKDLWAHWTNSVCLPYFISH